MYQKEFDDVLKKYNLESYDSKLLKDSYKKKVVEIERNINDEVFKKTKTKDENILKFEDKIKKEKEKYKQEIYEFKTKVIDNLIKEIAKFNNIDLKDN